MDQRTNQPTDRVTYRVACMRLKIGVFFANLLHSVLQCNQVHTSKKSRLPKVRRFLDLHMGCQSIAVQLPSEKVIE